VHRKHSFFIGFPRRRKITCGKAEITEQSNSMCLTRFFDENEKLPN